MPIDPATEAAALKAGKGFLSGLKNLIVIREKLEQLESEGNRLRAQVMEVIRLCERIGGQLQGIDKRFGEMDKRVEMTIKLQVREEVDRRLNGS